MEQEIEPLQKSNEVRKKFNYKKFYIKCGKCICIIFVIVMIWLTFCYGERNLSEEQQICKY